MSDEPEPVASSSSTDEPLLPVALAAPADVAWVELGRRLFESPILSGDGRVRCADCHLSTHGYADPHPRSELPGRPPTAFNSPALYNLDLLFSYTWSGRFDSLEAHLDALMTNPKVMATSWPDVEARLRADPGWRAEFGVVFPDGATGANARAALLAYERSLVTASSPFDRWLEGDATALSAGAKRGHRLFLHLGCAKCHQGRAVGGNMRARLGVVSDYFGARVVADSASLGRFAQTHQAADRYVFRVPSLRGVGLTAPYFHDGSVPTLERAVVIMARYQLGAELSTDEVTDLVAFLRALSAEQREQRP